MLQRWFLTPVTKSWLPIEGRTRQGTVPRLWEAGDSMKLCSVGRDLTHGDTGITPPHLHPHIHLLSYPVKPDSAPIGQPPWKPEGGSPEAAWAGCPQGTEQVGEGDCNGVSYFIIKA